MIASEAVPIYRDNDFYVPRFEVKIGERQANGEVVRQTFMQVTFQRMPNVSLLPGDQDIGVDQIVAATDRGILIRNRGSWSIDHQRYNFQFSGQAFYEVRNGKIAGMLRDVAYQANTPVFWNSMDMIGGKSSVLARGCLQRRQGRAEPDQFGEPRLCAGPLPRRHDSQHRAERIARTDS